MLGLRLVGQPEADRETWRIGIGTIKRFKQISKNKKRPQIGGALFI